MLTLDEILGRYFLKEWVQDELRDVGEASSGDKDELIERFLNSKRIRKRSVDDIAVDLLSSLRVTELKQIAGDLGTRHQGKHGQILKGILGSVAFEPFVRSTTRYCAVCLNETPHELHFGVDWEADHFKCEICGKVSSVRPIENENQGDQFALQKIFDIHWTGPIQVPETRTAIAGEHDVADVNLSREPPEPEGHVVGEGIAPSEDHEQRALEAIPPALMVGNESERESISQQALAWAVALGGVGVFLAISIPVALAYGWIVGVVSGIVGTIVAGVVLISTRRYWVSRLLELIK